MIATARLDAPLPGVELWWADLSAGPCADELGSLSDDERGRAERFVFERDRRRFLAAHCALRQLLAARTGTDRGSLRFRQGPLGKPYLEGHASCAFNLSHSHDVALVALADAGEIGVDVEILRAFADASALAQAHYTAAEQAALAGEAESRRDLAFLLGWTRKEACLKAIGSGLSIDPSTFEVGLVADARIVCIGTPDGPARVTVQSRVYEHSVIASIARVL